MSLLLTCLILGCPARGGHALPVPPPRGGEAVEPSNVDIGQSLAAKRGWFGEQWSCLYALWNRESGWTTPDTNPSSGAAGIPQALPPSKMGDGWESDVRQQIAWGLAYIRSRYGSPCAAWAHSNAYGFY